MKRMRAVESDSVKSGRKAKDKLHRACERAQEIRERTLHRQEQNRMHMASMRESRDSLVSTQLQSHAVMCRGFGTSVPFISLVLKSMCSIDHKRGTGIPCLTMHEVHVELCWCDD